jgi:hypothetical protein
METEQSVRTLKAAIGCLMSVLAGVTIASKVFSYSGSGPANKTLSIVSVVGLALFIFFCIVWTVVGALSRVRFGLGKMMAVIWAIAASITCIVASASVEIISVGIFGLVILTAYLIAGVARANVSKNEE